ncbi:hypothetical protein GZ980_001510 [Clostridium perfringens]
MDNKEIIRIRTKIFKNQKLIGPFISNVKYNNNNRYKSEIVENIFNKKIPGIKYISKGILPKDYEILGSTCYIPFQSNKLINELQWMNLLINKYKKEISMYLKYKEQYEKYILNGKYDDAKKTLNKIEEFVCKSIWGTSQRFLIVELNEGIKEHKRLLAELSEKSKSSIVKFILDFYSFKVELNNNYDSLKYKIEKRFPIKKMNFQSEILKEYLMFKLDVKYISKDIDKIAKVLSMENIMSIIDIYESYIKAIHCLIINKEIDFNIKKEICIELKNLKNKIDDYRIDKSLAFFSNEKINLNCKEHYMFSKILDEYTRGEYTNAISLIEKYNLLELGNFNIYDVYVKSNLFINNEIKYENKKTLSEEIMFLMYCIYSRNDIKKNIQEIINKALILSEFKIKNNIINFAMQFEKDKNIDLNYLSEFNSEFYTPKSLGIYHNNDNILVDEFKNNKLFEVTLGVFNNTSDSSIDFLRRKFYEASSLIKEDINKSINLFEEIYYDINNLNEGKKIYYTSKVCESLYYLYIKAGKYNDALNIIVNTYFLNKDSIYNINLEKLKNEIELENYEEIYRNINIVIYTFLLDNKDYDEQYKSLANYIEANGALLFLDLLEDNCIKNNYKKQLYFICEKIYTLELIKRFVFIEKNQRINERIKTIRYLISEKYNEDLLQKELNLLVKEQSIRENIKTLDASKIVADSKGILQELDGVYKSKFERFLELKDLKLDVIYVNLNESNIEKDNISSILTNVYEKQQQSYMLFKELIEEYINELLFNLNYGLDKFLSSRIRHGMLRDYLSKPFTNNNILNTKKDSCSIEYIYNQYVENKMKDSDDEIRVKVIEILSEFSIKIMSKIEEVEDWIRIKSDEDINGLFDYSKIEDCIVTLYRDLGDIADYNTFYEKITDVFWNITEESLIIIRKKFDEELYNYFRKALNELLEKLRELSYVYNHEILKDLQAKVGVCTSILKQDLTLVRNWFQIKKDNQYVDFVFQDLISTCIEINNKLNKNYSKISNDVKVDLELVFRGDKFTYWIDIINILYVNAIKHSGFKDIEDIHININANIIEKKEVLRNNLLLEDVKVFNKFKKSKNNFMIFSIENNLSENINESEIEKKVSEIFNNMKIRSCSNYVTMEGGTGIYKIDNILKNNIKSQYIYSCICRDKKFNIDIIVELNDEIIVR